MNINEFLSDIYNQIKLFEYGAFCESIDVCLGLGHIAS